MRIHYILAVLVLLAACTTTVQDAPTEQTDTMQEPDVDEGAMEEAPESGAMMEEPAEGAMEEAPESGAMMEEPDKVFVLTGENFAFFMEGEESPVLRVNQGDLVRIEFTSTDGFHDWVLDVFDAATGRVQSPDSTSVEFVADQVGEFEYYCSVGRHRAQGMFGTFIVE